MPEVWTPDRDAALIVRPLTAKANLSKGARKELLL